MPITSHMVVSAGPIFAVSGLGGDIAADTNEGFYAQDTRFLSAYRLLINGTEPEVVGSGQVDHVAASFYGNFALTPEGHAPDISVVRDRYVAGGMHEDISVMNHSPGPLAVKLELCFDADFADIFEVRRGTVRKMGRVTEEEREGAHLCLAYRQGTFHRETWITFSVQPEMQGRTAVFQLRLEPRKSWRTCVSVHPVVNGAPDSMPCIAEVLGPPFSHDPPRAEPVPTGFVHEDAHWDTSMLPRFESSESGYVRAYHQAISDLRALRMEVQPGQPVLAAGLPWFMAIFGRDSIISAIQTKMLGPELMTGTLRTLAALQAKTYDVFREAEPGKIPHEVRRGELSVLERVPHSQYYGSIDATPLFIVLLWEAYEWTGDRQLLVDMLPAAEAAMGWIDRYGDRDGDGFIEHVSVPRRRRNFALQNQGWKDSEDSISYADGRLADGPIALAEVQGYVYDAKRRMAKIYELLQNTRRARRLEREAQELKNRFNEVYWLPEESYYAVALDGRGNRVDSVTSNPGHCLWSGIIETEKAGRVVDRLLAPDMFSGWGVRTLSSHMARYNPVSYHNGSIWPHDNSIVAAGMARYGYVEQARRVACAVMEAAAAFPGTRLPELFAGYPRRQNSFPVPYPDANIPQAWACGAVIYFLETLLGVVPMGDRLMQELRTGSPTLSMSGVPYRGERRIL